MLKTGELQVRVKPIVLDSCLEETKMGLWVDGGLIFSPFGGKTSQIPKGGYVSDEVIVIGKKKKQASAEISREEILKVA